MGRRSGIYKRALGRTDRCVLPLLLFVCVLPLLLLFVCAAAAAAVLSADKGI